MCLNAAAREADKLHTLLKLGKIPILSFTLFFIGNCSLVLGGSFSISIIYGVNSQIIWCVIATFVAVAFLFINIIVFMPVGHIKRCWYKKDPDDFREKMDWLMEKLEKSMNNLYNAEKTEKDTCPSE